MNTFNITKCVDCGHSRCFPDTPNDIFCELLDNKMLLDANEDNIPDECPKLIKNVYRLAVKDDVGKHCYFSDMSIEDAVLLKPMVHKPLKKVNKDCFVDDHGIGWRYAAINRESV